MADLEFKPWGKTARLKSFDVVITEKLDGTNSCVIIQDGKLVGTQSRNRLITPEDDNFGFSKWCWDNQLELERLGDGYHYGEWVGPGIQKNPMMLDEKQFYLFNTYRPADSLPDLVKQVPVLYEGPWFEDSVDEVASELQYQRVYEPEGVVVYFPIFRKLLKWTFKYQEGKWKDQ